MKCVTFPPILLEKKVKNGFLFQKGRTKTGFGVWNKGLGGGGDRHFTS